MIAAVALGAVALSSTALTPVMAAGEMIGVAMPTKSSARWIDDGNNMVAQLKAKGYNPDLQYADDDIPNQLAQVENMVTKGAKVLVVASIDGTTLSDVLAKAHDAGVKVIAYDRLIRKVRRTSTTTRPSTTSRSACCRRRASSTISV